MQHLIPLFALLAILFIGFLVKRAQLNNYRQRLDFCCEYHDKFIDLVNHFTSVHTINEPLYRELTAKAPKMQQELSSDGLMTVANHTTGIGVKNYQALINFLPEMKKMLGWLHNSIMREQFMTFAQTCDDMFTRHIGKLNDAYESEQSTLFNPISCFAAGIRWILWLPSNVLLWCGFISYSTGHQVRNSLFMRLITFLVTMIGLLSSIVTIIIGWDEFINTIKKIAEKFIEL